MSTDLNENSSGEGLKEANEEYIEVTLDIRDEDRVIIASQNPLPSSRRSEIHSFISKLEIPTHSGQLSTEITSSPPAIPWIRTDKKYIHSGPPTPRTPRRAGGESSYKVETRGKRLKFWVLIEWIALVCIMGTLISSLIIGKLVHFKILELHLWKWCVLLLVIVCGRLFTEWFYNGLVFLIERNLLLRKKVLYFVCGLKESVQICIGLVLVLLSWAILFNGRIKRSHSTNKILDYVTRALASFLVVAVIWLIKTILILNLAASVNVRSFVGRIGESLYHQYIIEKLSGPPLMELAENFSRPLSFQTVKKSKEWEGLEVIDVAKFHNLKQDEVSSWTMKSLSNVVIATKLSTISQDPEDFDNKEITSEGEAKDAAYEIFSNVSGSVSKYITEEDLSRFLSEQEVNDMLPLFEGAVEARKIRRTMLKNWVLKAYHERESLALALKDAQIAVKQLNKVVSILVFVMFVIVWLISMGLATTEVLLFIASQIFIFGNTTKAVFEGIIFVFLTHPFDVGDHCVIDGVQMIVKEINIMRTGFLRYDNQKIYYPNAVLATKSIGNMLTNSSNTSPFMSDAVEFAVDASTAEESIEALKDKIKMYIDSKPEQWNPDHDVVVLEIDESKMKMVLYVSHAMNHQNMREKIRERSYLVLELKKIFEELHIKFHILPQKLPVSFADSEKTAPLTTG